MRERIAWALVGVLGLLVVAGLAGVIQGGPLDPPGTPAPTGKTLPEIEPRTPISSIPVTIFEPGSYYLTGNLETTSPGNAITITADNVTLDLSGFTLRGNTQGTNGIVIANTAQNVTVRNGKITAWVADGISAATTFGTTVEDIEATANGDEGIAVSTFSVVRHCTASFNGEGIDINAGEVDGCVVQQNSGNGIRALGQSVIRNCIASANGSVGILADGTGARIESCDVYSNTGDGIRVTANAYVVNNIASSNGAGGVGAGVHAISSGNRIEGNVVEQNDFGFDVDLTGNLIIRNTARANGAGNYTEVVANNSLGPVVTSGDIGTNPNPHANYQP